MSELQQFCMSCGGGISHTADQAGTDIFCMHCGHKNQLKSQSAQSHSPPPAPSMPGGSAVNEKDNDTDIYLLKNSVQDGPWKRPRITYLLGTGQIAPETMIWWEGKDAWGPLNGQTEIDFTQTAADQKQLMAPIDEEEAANGEKPPAQVSYNGQTFLADSAWLEADIRREVLPESLLVFYQPFSEWKPASEWLYAIELDELSELEELEKEEYKPATSTPVAD
jgi:DNA-directed RNA polymerase subunit RPC12/RpoP